MINKSHASKRPCEPWTHDRLMREHAIAIANAIEPSSASTYSSALQSYIDFCSAHSLPNEPTPDTLSFYAVYMSHHIRPRSISSYLSGVCSQLEPFFPNVRTNRRHWLVSKTLEGCKKMYLTAPLCKRPLTQSKLTSLSPLYSLSTSYNDVLFFSLLLTGFHGLMQLGELIWPDNRALQDYRKIIFCHSVHVNDSSYQFLLPGHKADHFFKGTQVIVQSTLLTDDPLSLSRPTSLPGTASSLSRLNFG